MFGQRRLHCLGVDVCTSSEKKHGESYSVETEIFTEFRREGPILKSHWCMTSFLVSKLLLLCMPCCYSKGNKTKLNCKNNVYKKTNKPLEKVELLVVHLS